MRLLVRSWSSGKEFHNGASAYRDRLITQSSKIRVFIILYLRICKRLNRRKSTDGDSNGLRLNTDGDSNGTRTGDYFKT